jgi:hypothetical protein
LQAKAVPASGAQGFIDRVATVDGFAHSLFGTGGR